MYAQKRTAATAFLGFAILTVMVFMAFVTILAMAIAVNVYSTFGYYLIQVVGYTVAGVVYAVFGWDFCLRWYFSNSARIRNRAAKRFHEKLLDCTLDQPKDLLGVCIDALNAGAAFDAVESALNEDFNSSQLEIFIADIRDAPIVYRLKDSAGKVLATIPTV